MNIQLTRFQEYAKNRLERIHPEWKNYLEDCIDENIRELVYIINSPANPDNKLYIVITCDDITVKFAVQGSHEHYDIYCEGSEAERFEKAFNWAFEKYINPVLENKLVAVWHEGFMGGTLTSDPEGFLKMNPKITAKKIESWS